MYATILYTVYISILMCSFLLCLFMNRLLCFCVIFSILLLYFEPCYAADNCQFHDAWNAIYYSLITITTVGYGDETPTAPFSRLIGVLMMILGATYMAMPLAILGTSFEEVYAEYEKQQMLVDNYWAAKKMRNMQQVTRKERVARSMRVKDLIHKELFLLKINRQDRNPEGRCTLLRFLLEDTSQLALDLNVLFNLNREATRGSALYNAVRAAQFPTASESLWKRTQEVVTGLSKRKRLEQLDGEKQIQRHKSSMQETMLELVAQGQNEVVRLHTLHENECNYIKKAVQRNECHDRVFLCVKVRQSSTCAITYYRVNYLMVFLNVCLLFVETMLSNQNYGEHTFSCKRVVNYHCVSIRQTFCSNSDHPGCLAAKKNNPACFANDVTGYQGCNKGDIAATCDFPQGNMTCSNVALPPFETSVDYCHYADEEHLCQQYHGCTWYSGQQKCVEEQDSQVKIDVCKRLQCNDNDNYNFVVDQGRANTYFFYLELIFMIWFVVDLVLGIYVNQNEHESGYLFWFIKKQEEESDLNASLYSRCRYDFDNIIHFLATLAQVVGVIAVPLLFYKSPEYSVFGNFWKSDPYEVRFFRILIALRFAIMNQDVFRILSSTAARVFHKLLVPYLFFFVMALVFSTTFYVFESGDLYLDCEVNSIAPTRPDGLSPVVSSMNGQCRWCPVPYAQSNAKDITSASTKTVTSSTDYSEVYYFNGSCSSLVVVVGLDGTGRLQEPLIFDMFDSIWTMLVTMTTVGYGVKYPIQTLGKLISVMAALFGTFYISMPLTIVGGEFHSIYSLFRKEQSEQHDAIMSALEKKEESHPRGHGAQKKSAALNLKFNMAGKLKLFAKNARTRVAEKMLSNTETKKMEEYLNFVEKMNRLQNQDILAAHLEKLQNYHQAMMLIMALHLSHRSDMTVQTIFEEDVKEHGETKTVNKLPKNGSFSNRKSMFKRAESADFQDIFQ